MARGKIIQVCAIDLTIDKLLRKLTLLSIEEGYEVKGVCSEGDTVNKLREEGFDIICINIDRGIRPLSNIKSVINLYKLFRKEKPDIVHVHTPIAAVLGRIAAKLAGVRRVLYTAHGFYFHENMNPLLYKAFLYIEKFMAKFFTDFIFTQCNEDRNTALANKFIDENKIIAIGNGVDVSQSFNPANVTTDEIHMLKKELSILKDEKVITFVGRIVKEKGIIDLLEAFGKIRNHNIRLLIVGGVFQGERDNETAKLLNKYEKNPNIIFTGVRNDINNILYITDIFCLPSYREGMPRSIIEAMAMECAVVATNIRGSREEVIDGETGFLVETASPDIIKDKIVRLLDNEILLKSMKLSGRKRAEQLYDENKVVQLQLEVYEQLLNN